MSKVTDNSLVRGALYGAGAGIVASLAMAMYAMFASLFKDTGFMTPLYHIASLWAAPDTMMESMTKAMEGDGAFTFSFGLVILGAVIHMMTGAMYGAIFGLVIARLRVGAAIVTGAGLVYGAIVFVMSAFLLLPLAAAIFGSGEPISNMAEMAGWATFIIEHLLFGLVLGLLLARSHAHATLPHPAGAHH